MNIQSILALSYVVAVIVTFAIILFIIKKNNAKSEDQKIETISTMIDKLTDKERLKLYNKLDRIALAMRSTAFDATCCRCGKQFILGGVKYFWNGKIYCENCWNTIVMEEFSYDKGRIK